jgi:anti-sigma-K factor RskA
MYAYYRKENRLNIQQYISSGIIETYVMGLASVEEASQLERLLPFYPELQAAISDFGFQLELFAIQHEEPPPPGLFQKIQDKVRELPAVREPQRSDGRRTGDKDPGYIHVKENSTHIRVHKYWRIAFIAIFILSKLLLAAFIYYFIQFRHTEREMESLKNQQIKANKTDLSPESQKGDR